MLTLAKKYQFLFEELVKRDFKIKYKRTVLGMGWSVLSPLLQLLVMSLVFTQFFWTKSTALHHLFVLRKPGIQLLSGLYFNGDAVFDVKPGHHF